MSAPPWATDGLRERVAALASLAADVGHPTDAATGWPDFTTQHLAAVMATTGRTARADVELAAWSGVSWQLAVAVRTSELAQDTITTPIHVR